MWRWRIAVGLSLLATGCGASTTPAADLVILGGRVWTGNQEHPWAEAVAMRADRIVAVGTRAEIEALVGSATEVLDADGGMVTPGFIDAHVHFLTGGFNLASVQLRDATTPEEFARRIGEFTAGLPPGEWILGGDWDHELWGGDLPRRDWIDDLTPDNPVFVNRLDGHMALANSAAVAAAGITSATAEVEGGSIVRDPDGTPTGVFKDNAMDLVYAAIPAPSEAAEDRALQAAMEHVAARGVTSVHHMGTWQELAAFERAHRAESLLTRIYACTPLSAWQQLRDRIAASGRGDEWLRIGCLKGFVDGSLGSHTAAFFAPFADAPEDTGLLVNTPEDLQSWTEGADEAGLQVNIHAIGDRAIHLLLEIFEHVQATNGPRDRRFRIEHAQHLVPDDIPRFAALGVIASMQPYHAIDDGRWAEKVIGSERARTTYAFRSLLDAGTQVVFGSDWFVAPPTPLQGIYAAVTRRTLDGANPGGWVPEQKITVQEALTAYTIQGARASFEEEIKGSIETGKLADLALIDRDLTRIAPEEIAAARIVATIVGGRIVYSR